MPDSQPEREGNTHNVDDTTHVPDANLLIALLLRLACIGVLFDAIRYSKPVTDSGYCAIYRMLDRQQYPLDIVVVGVHPDTRLEPAICTQTVVPLTVWPLFWRGEKNDTRKAIGGTPNVVPTLGQKIFFSVKDHQLPVPAIGLCFNVPDHGRNAATGEAAVDEGKPVTPTRWIMQCLQQRSHFVGTTNAIA